MDMMVNIWSVEHSAWWKHGGHGYAVIRECAGVYTLEEGAAIVREANRFLKDGDPPNECLVPVG